jgi:uncharacterized protein YndB with AHSA1/START domain
MVFDYEFRLRIKAPRPTVFEKLLRIEHLARWFCGWSRIEPKVGGKFQFGGETCIVQPEGRGWETRIEEGETLRRFAFTWPLHGIATRVAYVLEDAGVDTLLSARHQGVPMKDSTCGTVQDAWRMCLGNLKSIAEGRSDSVRPDHTPVVGNELRLSNLIEVPTDTLFGSLTDPVQVDVWSTGGMPHRRTTFGAAEASAFFFAPGDAPTEVSSLDPNTKVRLTWPRKGYTLTVVISLEPKASGTAIYVSATGYPAGSEAAILRDRGRWSDLLVSLKNFLEAGDAGFANAYEDQVRETSSS